MRLYLFFPALLVALCAICSSGQAQSPVPSDCPTIDVKAEIIPTREGRNNGEVVLTFEKGVNTEEYLILLTCSDCPEPKKAVELSFKDLKPGHYDIYVIDKRGCSKQLNIQVN